MKSVISGLLVAFSMYSAIPVPQVNWEKQTMRWALGFLPLIGVLIGAIEWFWFAFCVHFGAAGVFYAVIAAFIWTACATPATRCARSATGKSGWPSSRTRTLARLGRSG